MKNLIVFLVLAAPVILVSGAHHEGKGFGSSAFGAAFGRHKHSADHHHHEENDDGEATVTVEPMEMVDSADLLSASNIASKVADALGDDYAVSSQNMTDDETAADGSEREGNSQQHEATPDPRITDWSGVTPTAPPVHPWGQDPWGQDSWGKDPWGRQQHSVYQDMHYTYPYADYGYDNYGYGYGYPSHHYYPVDHYGDYDYDDHHECPKCDCDKPKEYDNENEYKHDDYQPEESHEYAKEHEDYEKNDYHVDKDHYDHEDSYHSEDDLWRTTDETKAPNSRKKRSVDGFDWHSVGKPSPFLEQHNVGYRIKNHLRYRLREEKFPLHYGHILSGSHYGKHRSFYDHADFHTGYEADAFHQVPIGPRLDKEWIHHGFPVYGYNLYKLWKPVYGVPVTRKLVHSHHYSGKEIAIKPGVYRIVAVMDDKKGLIVQKVGGKYHHQRYILSHIFYDGTLHKFQAMVAWKDHRAKFVKVYNKTWGLVYLVRPSLKLHGGNPKLYKHEGKSDYYRFSHLKFEPSLLKPHNVVYKVKLSHKKAHHHDHDY